MPKQAFKHLYITKVIGVRQESISGRNLENRHGIITQRIPKKTTESGTKDDHRKHLQHCLFCE